MLCTGSTYAFSVIVSPLGEARGWSPEEIVLAFAINMAIAPIPMIISGKYVDKGYTKQCILIGGALFGIGYFLSGFATSIYTFYITYGLICGIGQATAYSGCLGTAVRFFPDKRGLAVGLVTAGNGGAAIFMAPTLSMIIQKFDAPVALKAVGILFIVVCLIAGSLVKPVPNGYVPKGRTPRKPAPGAAVNDGLPWNKMLRSPKFYMILVMFGIGTLSGLMIASNLSVIGQSMFNLSATVAALYVSIYSLSNCLGRIFWGAVSDKIGRYNALLAIFIVIGAMLLLIANATSSSLFLIAIVGIGLCFGGTMGVMPPIVTENFGAKYYGVNYGVIFISFSTAAFFGPKIAVNIANANNGDFTQAFYIAFICGLIGLAVTILFIINKKRQDNALKKMAA